MLYTYRTVKDENKFEYKINKSTFIGLIFSFECCNSLNSKLEYVKKNYPGANHYCFAYRILKMFENNCNVLEFSTDAKEPKNTAGIHILNSLKKYDLLNVILFVVRYFGGIKLGTAGLIDAYRTCSIKCVETSTIIEKEVCKKYKVSCPLNSSFMLYNILNKMCVNYETEDKNDYKYFLIEVPIKKDNVFLNELKGFDVRPA